MRPDKPYRFPYHCVTRIIKRDYGPAPRHLEEADLVLAMTCNPVEVRLRQLTELAF